MKIWMIALGLAMMLGGCGFSPAQQTTAPPPETTQPTEPAPITYYAENSVMERGTGGEVKQYDMDREVTGLWLMDGNLVVGDGGRWLKLLDRQTMEEQARLRTEAALNPGDLAMGPGGGVYYDRKVQAFRGVDRDLTEHGVYPLAEEPLGELLVSQDGRKVWFASSDGIRVMYLDGGTSRLVRQENGASLKLRGLLFEDSLLWYTRADGESILIDSENGSLNTRLDQVGAVASWEDRAMATLAVDSAMGRSTWLVAGDRSGNRARLDGAPRWEQALLLEGGLVLLQNANQVGLSLCCYDMDTGALVGKAILPQQEAYFVYACTDGTQIYLADGTGNRVYRWTPKQQQPDGVTLTPYTPLSQMEAQALDKARGYADTVGQRHGVQITLSGSGARTPGADYSVYPDYRPASGEQALQELDKVLKKLPEGLLTAVGRRSDSRKLEIILVDDYDPATGYTPATGDMDVSGGDLVITASICPQVGQIVLHELFHIMEMQMRNKKDVFLSWEECNPEEFAYANSAAAYESGALNDSPYVSESTRYFADAYSMVSPREDRAQVFVYACMDDQSHLFGTRPMQQKLGQVSDTLRGFYKLSGVPVWEQYRIREIEGTEPTE